MIPNKTNTAFDNFTENCDAERRKAFAREQVEFLKSHGIADAVRIGRIFRIAGPGQIQEAYKLATCTRDSVLIDVLDCLITGMGGSQDFGRYRMAKVLERCGFYVPQTHSTNCFFRTLDGALEILIPGSYIFEEDEEPLPKAPNMSLRQVV